MSSQWGTDDGTCTFKSMNEFPLSSSEQPHHDMATSNLEELTDHALLRPNNGTTVDIQYGCPYRKRNPWMFNVRDYPTCATQSFPSITLVKRHIMTSHKSKDFLFSCAICASSFKTEKKLEAHRTPGFCLVSRAYFTAECDKGVTELMGDRLRDRRASHQVLDWDTLWKTIFPGCGQVPDPEFQPIIEAHETFSGFDEPWGTGAGSGRI